MVPEREFCLQEDGPLASSTGSGDGCVVLAPMEREPLTKVGQQIRTHSPVPRAAPRLLSLNDPRVSTHHRVQMLQLSLNGDENLQGNMQSRYNERGGLPCRPRGAALAHGCGKSKRQARRETDLHSSSGPGTRAGVAWLGCASLRGVGVNLLVVGLLLLGLGDGLGVLLVLVDGPVEDVVVLEALTDEEIAEDLAQVRVVGLVVEAERACVVEIDGKLVGEATAEDLGGRGHLLLHDAVVLLLLGGRFESLPGQRATAEVEHDVPERLHVVTAGLLDAQVGVDAGVACRTRQVLVLTIWDVEVRLGVTILLGQAKVNDVDLVATLANAHEEVVWLDVAVDEGLCVDVLDAGDELVGEQQHRLEGELAVAEVEEILQAGAEQVEHHGVVVALGAEPADKGDADAASERLVDAGLIFELGMLGLDALELDGDFLAGDDVGACGG
jgi:hypothetical protein